MAYDISKMDLSALRQVDVKTVSLEELVDINEIEIDTTLSKEQRIVDYLRQVKNPYCFKVGKVAVSVGFSDDGITFQQRMEHYLQTL